MGSRDAKVVLFTHAVDPRFFRLASAVDRIIANNPKLAGSQVIVIDDKGAQRGGYTAEEILQRRQTIRKYAICGKVRV